MGDGCVIEIERGEEGGCVISWESDKSLDVLDMTESHVTCRSTRFGIKIFQIFGTIWENR